MINNKQKDIVAQLNTTQNIPASLAIVFFIFWLNGSTKIYRISVLFTKIELWKKLAVLIHT